MGRFTCVNYFCRALSLQAESGLGRKCEPNSCKIRRCFVVRNEKSHLNQKIGLGGFWYPQLYGKAPKGSYFRLNLCLQADNVLSRKCEPNSKHSFEDGLDLPLRKIKGHTKSVPLYFGTRNGNRTHN